MQKTKAIFFDVDGTLVSYRTHQMPQSALDALHALRSAGIRLVVCTGRPLYSLDEVRGWFTFDAYCTMNAQLCYVDGQVVRRACFERGDMERLVALLKESGDPCLVMGEHGRFVTAMNDTVREHMLSVAEPMPRVDRVERILDEDVYQLVLYSDEAGERAFAQALEAVEPVRAAPMCLDVIPGGCGKAHGIRALMAHWGITRGETMAFGDGMNDIDMIEYAGIGVAMGNADAPVKAAADYVTLSVDDDGLVHALKHFGLLAD